MDEAAPSTATAPFKHTVRIIMARGISEGAQQEVYVGLAHDQTTKVWARVVPRGRGEPMLCYYRDEGSQHAGRPTYLLRQFDPARDPNFFEAFKGKGFKDALKDMVTQIIRDHNAINPNGIRTTSNDTSTSSLSPPESRESSMTEADHADGASDHADVNMDATAKEDSAGTMSDDEDINRGATQGEDFAKSPRQFCERIQRQVEAVRATHRRFFTHIHGRHNLRYADDVFPFVY